MCEQPWMLPADSWSLIDLCVAFKSHLPAAAFLCVDTKVVLGTAESLGKHTGGAVSA